jgi:hypothetical protein
VRSFQRAGLVNNRIGPAPPTALRQILEFPENLADDVPKIVTATLPGQQPGDGVPLPLPAGETAREVPA